MTYGAGELLSKRHMSLIPESACEDHDEVGKPADAKKPKREQPDESREDFADVKPVYAEYAQKEAEKESRKLALLRKAAYSSIIVVMIVDDVGTLVIDCVVVWVIARVVIAVVTGVVAAAVILVVIFVGTAVIYFHAGSFVFIFSGSLGRLIGFGYFLRLLLVVIRELSDLLAALGTGNAVSVNRLAAVEAEYRICAEHPAAWALSGVFGDFRAAVLTKHMYLPSCK